MSAKDHARDAAEAHTDLNTFGAVVTLLEGGHLYRSKSHATADRIIQMAKKYQQTCLRDYDAAIAKVRA